jgi:molybdate transport system substrate-binding protein
MSPYGCENEVLNGGIVTSKHLAGESRRHFCFYAVLVALASLICTEYGSAQTTLSVSAAASLQDALAGVESMYAKSHAGLEFRNNFGPSGTLAVQIDQGAPADVFLSAAAKPMDDLEAKGLIVAGTRSNLLRNTLVLIAPLDSGLHDFQGLTESSVRSIALGDPASVPAGQYGRQTLASLHLLDRLNAKLVLAKDVRQVLAYVETGNADAGLVYGTDARISSKVRVVANAPDSAHDPIVYPVAVVKGSRNEQAARGFVDYLGSADAKATFVKHGFTIAAP